MCLEMVRRLIDILLSFIALTVLSPILIIITIGIIITDGIPVLYRAKRAGLNGKPFIMHKFRTMKLEQQKNSSKITSKNDKRVFWFGSLLRKSKLDELPQLIDVLMGKMAIIGPRPEDIDIVSKYYDDIGKETLSVRPGLASPGSIFNYTHGEQLLVANDCDSIYIKKLLPIKLRLDCYYVRNRSLIYDIKIIFRTVSVIFLILLGRKRFSYPPEYRYMSNSICDK